METLNVYKICIKTWQQKIPVAYSGNQKILYEISLIPLLVSNFCGFFSGNRTYTEEDWMWNISRRNQEGKAEE